MLFLPLVNRSCPTKAVDIPTAETVLFITKQIQTTSHEHWGILTKLQVFDDNSRVKRAHRELGNHCFSIITVLLSLLKSFISFKMLNPHESLSKGHR